jgi:hypothetical protein
MRKSGRTMDTGTIHRTAWKGIPRVARSCLHRGRRYGLEGGNRAIAYVRICVQHAGHLVACRPSLFPTDTQTRDRARSPTAFRITDNTRHQTSWLSTRRICACKSAPHSARPCLPRRPCSIGRHFSLGGRRGLAWAAVRGAGLCVRKRVSSETSEIQRLDHGWHCQWADSHCR